MITPRRVASVSVVLLAVACGMPSSGDGPTGTSVARIVYGTADTTHTAVVAILNPDMGGYDQCSGTIVQVKNGVGYVLTAAHCCNQTTPSIVVLSSDYSGSVQYITSSSPAAPAYAVIAGSVSFDPGYDNTSSTPIDDFCMLQFNAPANTPVIPVATGNDGLALGTEVEYVGFGETSTTTAAGENNTLREHASAPVDQAVNANYFKYTEGGTSHIGGPCEGDSGGPALLPAGAAQSAQVVVGTTSYGDPPCASYGVSMRVTSETGAGGFIANYLADGVAGNDGGITGKDAGSGGAPTTCAEANTTTGCCEGTTNYYCTTGGNTVSTKACTGGKVCGWDASKSYYACVAAPGGADPSGKNPLACGGSTSPVDSGAPGDGASSTDGSTGTDGSTADAATDGSQGSDGAQGDTGVGTGDGSTVVPDGATTADATSTVPDGSAIREADGGAKDGGRLTLAGSGTGASGFGGGGGSSGCSMTPSRAGSNTPWLAVGIAVIGVGARRRRDRRTQP